MTQFDIPEKLLTSQTIYSLGTYILRGEQPMTDDAQVLADWCKDRGIWDPLSVQFPRPRPMLGRVAFFWYQEFYANKKFRENSDMGFVLATMLSRLGDLGVLP